MAKETEENYKNMLSSLNLKKGSPDKIKEEYDPRTLWPLNPNFAPESIIANNSIGQPISNQGLTPIAGVPEVPINLPDSPAPTMQSAPVVDPLDIQMQAFANQKGAINDLTKAELQANEATRKALNDVLMKPEDVQANQQKIAKVEAEAEAKRKQIEDTTIKIKSDLEEYNNLGINSDRFWQNRSTGQKIMAGLAVFFGGVGAGPNGQNDALKIIDNAIDRDIKEQEIVINKKGQSINQQRGLLSDLNNQLGNLDAAKSAYRLIAATNLQHQLSVIASKTNDAKVKANSVIAISQLDQSKAALLTDVIQKAKIQEARSYLSNGSGIRQEMVSRLPQEEQDRYIEGPGYYGLARGSKEDISKMKQATIDASSALKTIDKLSNIKRQVLPLTEMKSEAAVLKNMLVGNLKTFIVGSGAISEPEWKILHDTIPNPAELSNINGQHKLKVLRETLLRGVQVAAHVNGLKVDNTYDLKSIFAKATEKVK